MFVCRIRVLLLWLLSVDILGFLHQKGEMPFPRLMLTQISNSALGAK